MEWMGSKSLDGVMTYKQLTENQKGISSSILNKAAPLPKVKFDQPEPEEIVGADEDQTHPIRIPLVSPTPPVFLPHKREYAYCQFLWKQQCICELLLRTNIWNF